MCPHCTLGLADPKAVSIAVAALDAVQSIGMPEADCIIAQTAVYLARAPKSQEACVISNHEYSRTLFLYH